MFELFGAYSEFVQKYIEVKDDYRGLESHIEELKKLGEEIPLEVLIDHNKHFVLVYNFEKIGLEKYNKTPNELYKEGWEYWTKEDLILREKRYGKK